MGSTREEMDWVRHSNLKSIQVHLHSGEVFHFYDSEGRVGYDTPSYSDTSFTEDGRLKAVRGTNGWDIRVMRPFRFRSGVEAHEIGESFYIPHRSVKYISIDCKTREEGEGEARWPSHNDGFFR